MVRRSTRWAWLVVLALSVPAFDGGAATSAETVLQFADGDYEGTIDYTGQIAKDEVSAFAGVNGTFALTVTGGTINEGTFQAGGSGTSDVAGVGQATLDITVNGTIDGPSHGPIAHGLAASFSGEATVSGITVPLNFAFAGGDFTPVPFTIETATCNMVVGDFVQQFAANLSAQGFSNELYGRFVAIRKGSGQSATETLSQLIDDATAVATAAVGGSLDPQQLLDVVLRAENFSRSLATNEKCNNLKDPGGFNTAITGIMADLLDYAIANADRFTTADLFLLASSAVSVGALGEGATDQPHSLQTLAQLESIVSSRLDAAIAEHNTSEIETLYTFALSFGWTDLSSKAGKAL
jgi:hypothetical protein